MDWGKMSTSEREAFIMRASTELVDNMKDNGDAKGLQAFHDGLVSLCDYAEKAEVDTEFKARRDEIINGINRVCQYATQDGISFCLVELLESLTENARLYAEDAEGLNPQAAVIIEKAALNNAKKIMQAHNAEALAADA